MAEILKLAPAPGSAPDPDLVQFLEQLLERARRGDVVGVACAYEHGDAASSWRIVGRMNMLRTIGTVSVLERDLMAQIDG